MHHSVDVPKFQVVFALRTQPGIVSAIVASEDMSEKAVVRAANVARYLLWQGVEMQRAFGPAVTEGTAMAAVSGLAQEELSKFLVDTTTCSSQPTFCIERSPSRY